MDEGFPKAAAIREYLSLKITVDLCAKLCLMDAVKML